MVNSKNRVNDTTENTINYQKNINNTPQLIKNNIIRLKTLTQLLVCLVCLFPTI